MMCPHGLPNDLCGRCELPDPFEPIKPWREYTEELTHEIVMRDGGMMSPRIVIEYLDIQAQRLPTTDANEVLCLGNP